MTRHASLLQLFLDNELRSSIEMIAHFGATGELYQHLWYSWDIMTLLIFNDSKSDPKYENQCFVIKASNEGSNNSAKVVGTRVKDFYEFRTPRPSEIIARENAIPHAMAEAALTKECHAKIPSDWDARQRFLTKHGIQDPDEDEVLST